MEQSTTARIILSVLLLISVRSYAVESPPPFHMSEGCVETVSRNLSNINYGKNKEPFDSDGIGTLCTANDPATATACVKGTAQKFGNMRPLGLATVCSGGATSKEAIGCLSSTSPKMDNWVAAVDACTGVARQAVACFQNTQDLRCNANDAGKKPTTSNGIVR